MAKTIEGSFADWEGNAFGFGYGTGEPHVLAALKTFFAAVGRPDMPDLPNAYDYERLEAAVTAPVAWLLISALCRANAIEYGTSPRFGWLTPQGERVKAFVEARTVDELVEICCSDTEETVRCYPDACNCGPSGGYEKGRKCDNPFWP